VVQGKEKNREKVWVVATARQRGKLSPMFWKGKKDQEDVKKPGGERSPNPAGSAGENWSATRLTPPYSVEGDA